jgi:hypothetical protein
MLNLLLHLNDPVSYMTCDILDKYNYIDQCSLK